MDNALETWTLDALRSGGLYTPEQLHDELQRRADLGLLDGITGLIGVGPIKTCLRSLRLQGVARETESGWEFVAPVQAVETKRGREKQGSLFA